MTNRSFSGAISRRRLPLMVSPVATSFIMDRTMFDPSVGPIHDLLTRFGLPSIPWLIHPVWAMVTLMIIDSWSGTAFMILLFTAGLQGMPQSLTRPPRWTALPTGNCCGTSPYP
jgi:ABC-type sugar transport system permease subunit